MVGRAWPAVQQQAGLGFRAEWLARLLDVCLRSELKQLLAGLRTPPTTRGRQA